MYKMKIGYLTKNKIYFDTTLANLRFLNELFTMIIKFNSNKDEITIICFILVGTSIAAYQFRSNFVPL